MDDPQAAADLLQTVLAEYLLRVGRGERVDRETLVAAHPEVAGQLRAFFSRADALQALVPPGPSEPELPSPGDLAADGAAAENPPQALPLDPVAQLTTDWQAPVLKSSDKARVEVESRPPPATSIPEEHPAQIGRYTVEAILGSGAFGSVYRCYDGVLNRWVAVKVPHRHLLNAPELYLEEARVVASLEHPAIVPVYDAGRTDGGLCYVVSKFIEGSDLKTRTQEAPLSRRDAVELAATMAEALHYAHVHGIVHRDLKPANILIDSHLRPYLADFGLALREGDFGQRGKGAGTPIYMSPEQARCEGHLVDGRSDIFSLGVVLYELLTATRPFRGSTTEEILERIRIQEPRPPRQIDDTIPKELERICLKALSKRASDRYSTARDMAEDLRAFLAESPEAASGAGYSSRGADASLSARQAAETVPGSTTGADSDRPVKIVPKGLRSFDQSDADFFLKLLPGPHDRHGLPESIHFWKTRIEETDPENSFRVGIIYGPSGCGKSSLIKAGLLPRLEPAVVKVYVEASAAETEQRLLRNLHRHLPGLNEETSLVAVLAALRRGQGLAPGDKVLLVIDQFEQWLHGHGGEKDAELVLALRQCDGVRVQCLVMVRDDFWLAVSRFMQALEVRVVEGENSRLVDLFDARHARKVLAALGTAFGALPHPQAGTRGRGKPQDAFLDQAVAGLAQGGRVVSVRLALFAEMVKSKPWTPSALREIGGAEGVGVAFLEETFSSPTAPPHHRLQQKTAQSVLAALLPEAGTDIKGHMRSREELMQASGCGNQPQPFEAVMALLDNELRLVTPADPESLEKDGDSAPPAAHDKKYQLTHDYLVPSLRTWLTRKQKATRRGRAELLLADLASLWTAKPEGRRLPSLLEFLQIRFFMPPRTWNEGQRKMMTVAVKHHALRGLAATIVVLLIAAGAWQYQCRLKANELHEQLFRAELDKVPLIINDLANYGPWVTARLRQDYDDAKNHDDEARRLRASLALLPGDKGQVDYLYDRLIDAAPGEFGVVRQALLPYQDDLREKLWGVVRSPRDDQQYLCAASTLALYAPDDPQWNTTAAEAAAILARVNPFFAKYWTDALRGVGEKLADPLSRIARNPLRSAEERLTATSIMEVYAPDRADLLTPVLIDGSDAQFAVVFPLLEKLGPEPLRLLEAELDRAAGGDPTDANSELVAQRKARAAVALLRLGRPEKVWPLLNRSRDQRVRSYLVHWSSPLGVDRQMIVRQLTIDSDVGKRAALLLLLGEFPAAGLPEDQRRRFSEQLLVIFEQEPDPGLHAAAQWLLRRWKCDKPLQDAIERLARGEARRHAAGELEARPWYVNGQGQTFVVVDARQPFLMGSPASEPERDDNEPQHRRTIGRRYAIAASPVTKAQFERFQRERPHVAKMPIQTIVRTGDSPITGMTWYEAAEYCNWLSEKEGIAADQWCYEPNQQGQFAEGMCARDKYLSLRGYRLPTEAEWEFACRAGTVTRFYYGESDALLANYAWYRINGSDHTWPVASLKPNDLGLFDMHGNVWQWCESPPQAYPPPGLAVNDDGGATGKVTNGNKAMLRGGAYNNSPAHVRAACRGLHNPDMREKFFGFRPARTMREAVALAAWD